MKIQLRANPLLYGQAHKGAMIKHLLCPYAADIVPYLNPIRAGPVRAKSKPDMGKPRWGPVKAQLGQAQLEPSPSPNWASPVQAQFKPNLGKPGPSPVQAQLGQAQLGPQWSPGTDLGGPRPGCPDGAHFGAQLGPKWGPAGNATRVL